MSADQSPYAALKVQLDAGRMVLIDGGTGTELEHRGAEMVSGAWCAMATLTAPETLREVHRDYIRAGAGVITINTFSTNRNMLDPAGLGHHFEEANRRPAEVALEAREDALGRVVRAPGDGHELAVGLARGHVLDGEAARPVGDAEARRLPVSRRRRGRVFHAVVVLWGRRQISIY